MKKFVSMCAFLALLTAGTACAQVCIITCVVKDVTNVVYQGLKLVELRAILQEVSEQAQIARDVRDGARRARDKYRAFTGEIDRAVFIRDARARVVDQVVDQLHASGAISYSMDADQYDEVFAMGRPIDDPDYVLNMNTRAMTTVTATLASLKEIAAQAERDAETLDILAARLERAQTLEERQAVEASVTLLRARHKALRATLAVSETNMNGAMNAVGLDAGANAIMNHRRDQQALRDYIHPLPQSQDQ
ncbi:MAG: hypothetical protein OXG94_10885 [Bacteroidetes bacterium]|nr:hypothetical protein [Bacteroidota bacterium]